MGRTVGVYSRNIHSILDPGMEKRRPKDKESRAVPSDDASVVEHDV